MSNILIVDDDQFILNKLKADILSLTPESEIDCAISYEDAISYIENKHYSVFFLDIQLMDDSNDRSGINLAYYIRNINFYNFTPIVFVTTIDNKIEEALNNIHCIGYLVKPYSFEQLRKCINHIQAMPEMEPPLSYKDVTGTTFKIKRSDIIYLKSNRHTIFIYGKENVYELLHTSLDSFQKDLGNDFMRCHKSYIVNRHYITGSIKTPPQLQTPLGYIPIGRTYRKNMKDRC